MCSLLRRIFSSIRHKDFWGTFDLPKNWCVALSTEHGKVARGQKYKSLYYTQAFTDEFDDHLSSCDQRVHLTEFLSAVHKKVAAKETNGPSNMKVKQNPVLYQNFSKPFFL